MKSIITMRLAISLSLGMLCMTVQAAEADEAVKMQNTAEALKSLTLFRGSDKGFELDRAPTRMEAIIMLIRLLGKDSAIYGDENGNPYTHPFTDAPGWQDANEYLGYAYATGLTNGTSETTFEPNSPASAQMLVTFTLRALGYTDSESGKLWDIWYEKANELNIGVEYLNEELFTRGHAVMLYWDALYCTLNGTDQLLHEKLAADWVFAPEAMAIAEQLKTGNIDLSSDLDVIMASLYAKVPATFHSIMHTPIDTNDADSQTWYMGTSDINFKEALAAEPMMLAQAHSVVLVRLKKAADADKVMETMKSNVDGRKWICVGVEPENIRTAAEGDLVLLVLDNQYSQAFVDAFHSLVK